MDSPLPQDRPASPLRILFLAVSFENWVCSTLYHEQRAIARQLPDGVFYGPGYEYRTNQVADILVDTFGARGPDAIFCYIDERRLLGEPLADAVIGRYRLPESLQIFPKGLRDISIPKIGWINDFWHCTRDEWDTILLGNRFDAVFATYCPPFCSRRTFDTFFSRRVQEAVRFIPWPRAIDPKTFHSIDGPKHYDVTLLGAMDPDFYPLRTEMHRTFSQQRGLAYFHQPHPGYAFMNPGDALTGDRYARVINESRIFASCTGRYQIPFIKLYEILACGTMLMCDEPAGANYLGLEDRETFAAVTSASFTATTRRYLDERRERERVAHNGRALFERCHTVEIRAREWADTVARLLRGHTPRGWAELSVA